MKAFVCSISLLHVVSIRPQQVPLLVLYQGTARWACGRAVLLALDDEDKGTLLCGALKKEEDPF